MVDAGFANPRLANLFDLQEGDRVDLDHYQQMAAELGAASVLDIGCGTGTLLCRLAASGLACTGVDPAAPLLSIAAAKPWAQHVQWVNADATALPVVQVDLAVMTGNVAQVILDDGGWRCALRSVHRALSPNGYLVFEARDPAVRAWESWTRSNSYVVLDVPGEGQVETWVDVTDVSLPLVSFRWTYRFASDGAELVSDSTLRFRERDEIEASLVSAGFVVRDVRDAPDRPGKEFVFMAQRSE